MSGLILLAGVWAGLTFAEKYAPRFQIGSSQIYSLVSTALLCGLLAARLTYLMRYPNLFLSDPISIVSLNPSLLDFRGGLLIGMLAGILFLYRRKISVLSALDAITPFLLVMGMALALSDLASGQAYGAPTNLPWGITLWGLKRHPSQIYALMAWIMMLVLLWPGRWRIETHRPGQYFFVFLALFSATRIITETFRGDSFLLPGGFRAVQISAWILLAGALWFLRETRKT